MFYHLQYCNIMTILSHRFLLANQGKRLKAQCNSENACTDTKINMGRNTYQNITRISNKIILFVVCVMWSSKTFFCEYLPNLFFLLFLLLIQMSATLERSLMFLIYIDPLTSILCSLIFVVTVCLRYFSVFIPEICDLVRIDSLNHFSVLRLIGSLWVNIKK